MGRGGRGSRSAGALVDREHVCAHLVPLAEVESALREEPADHRGIPTKHFFENGNENAHGVVAKHGTARDTRDEFVFGHGDGEAVVLVDVHHDRQIGTAVAHINDVVVADAERGAQLLKDGDLSPTRRSANDRIHFTSGFVETEARAEDVIRGNDALKRRLDDLLRRGGNDVERNFVAVAQILERTRKQADVMLQTDALAGFDQVFAADAAEIGVVQDQIGELGTLLHKVNVRKALHLFVEIVEADELTQRDT